MRPDTQQYSIVYVCGSCYSCVEAIHVKAYKLWLCGGCSGCVAYVYFLCPYYRVSIVDLLGQVRKMGPQTYNNAAS